MKNLILITFLIVYNLAHAQNCDISYDYGNAVDWNIVDLNNSGQAVGGRITINNNQVNFIAAPDGANEVRVWRNTQTTLCNSWIAEFDFISNVPREGNGPGTANDGKTVGHVVFAATAGNLAPTEGFNRITTNQDMIGVTFIDDDPLNDFRISLFFKDGTNRIIPLENTQVDVPIRGNWHITLERIDGEKVRMTVNDNTTGAQIGQVCVSVPLSIQGLTHIQHSNNPIGDSYRILTGSVSNTCIRNCEKLDICCVQRSIDGPSEICLYGEFDAANMYSVPASSSANYTWIVPGAQFRGQNSNSIAVTDWGWLGTHTIQLIIECGCFTDTLTKIVQVSSQNYFWNDANWGDTWAQSSGNYANITLTADVTAPNLIHQWFLHFGEDCYDDSDPISVLQPVIIAQATGASVSFNNLSLPVTGCYVVRHLMWEQNSTCPPVERRKHQSPNNLRIWNGKSPVTNRTNSRKSTMKKESEGILVYPNPTSGELTIQNLSEVAMQEIIIRDVKGAMISKPKFEKESENMNVDISNFPKGQYLIEIIKVDGSRQTQKITKE